MADANAEQNLDISEASTIMNSPKSTENHGLAEPAMLKKIDKLFSCGVGALVDLPQIVDVGDQSSGKSSVLEGLINKPLPRDSGLCTRFATQIAFRRAAKENIHVSIIPHKDASSEHITQMKNWKKEVKTLDSDAFKKIMSEVHEQMGLSTSTEDVGKPTFSNDVLHLEIKGPNQEHLSVIDVPGIFKSTTEGKTTKADIALVRDMVHDYMVNPRSVMLAVIPANVDVATQEILDLAKDADEHGDRTLGVFTKPDLVDEGAEDKIIEIVDGRARAMKLGWHIIRNPGQKDLTNTTLDRAALEANFFRTASPWKTVEPDKVGIESLRTRLQEVLSSLVKRVFPKVKSEVKDRLDTQQKRLDALGPERGGSKEQGAYLGHMAGRFQKLVTFALNAQYGADEAFANNSALCLAPMIVARTEAFADDMAKYGQTYTFLTKDGHDPPESGKDEFNIRKEDDLEDLADILHPTDTLKDTAPGKIRDWLHEVFLGNRGFELGTFNATILATAMRKQTVKWADITLAYVSDVIVMIHRYITTALAHLCGDASVRESLASAMSDQLIARYQKAIDNAKFLLEVENTNMPMTMNHYFNDNLQKSRHDKILAKITKNQHESITGDMVIGVATAAQAVNMSNDEHVVHEIHDILKAYYKVSRKTFVDTVCKQAVGHFLLHTDKGPLGLFSHDFVIDLSPDELSEIAGEPASLERTRKALNKEVTSLTEAIKILR